MLRIDSRQVHRRDVSDQSQFAFARQQRGLRTFTLGNVAEYENNT